MPEYAYSYFLSLVDIVYFIKPLRKRWEKGWTQKTEKLSGIIMDSPSLVFDRCPKVGQEMPRGIKKRSLHAPTY